MPDRPQEIPQDVINSVSAPDQCVGQIKIVKVHDNGAVSRNRLKAKVLVPIGTAVVGATGLMLAALGGSDNAAAGVDACPRKDGVIDPFVQPSVPLDYHLEGDNCVKNATVQPTGTPNGGISPTVSGVHDACPRINGVKDDFVQPTIPVQLEDPDGDGNCTTKVPGPTGTPNATETRPPADLCLNLEGIQNPIPYPYIEGPGHTCVLPTATPTPTRTATPTATPTIFTPTATPTTPTECRAAVRVGKWNDVNGNGVQDGEPGLPWNITVSGTDLRGGAYGFSVATNASGLSDVIQIPCGSVSATEQQLLGWTPTTNTSYSTFLGNGGFVDWRFGNRIVVTPTATPTQFIPTITPTSTPPQECFGQLKLEKIHDRNKNGTRNAGEETMAWSFNIDYKSNGEGADTSTTTTYANGEWSVILNLPGGRYGVEEITQSGYAATGGRTKTEVTVPCNAIIKEVFYNYQVAPGETPTIAVSTPTSTPRPSITPATPPETGTGAGSHGGDNNLPYVIAGLATLSAGAVAIRELRKRDIGKGSKRN